MTTTTIRKTPKTIAELNRPPRTVLSASDLDDSHQVLREDLARILGINIHSLPRAFGGSAGSPVEGGVIRDSGKSRPWYWGKEVKRWVKTRPRARSKEQ